MAQDTITIRSDELREEVEEYQRKAGYDDLSPAAKDVMRLGIREIQSPLLRRAREQAVTLTEMLVAFALIFLAAGIVTNAVPYGEALRMTIVLLSAAVTIPSLVGLARVVNGSSDLGAALHEVIDG